MIENCAIRMEKVSKSFGNVTANKDVDLEVRNGEIHALLGENGAGKSTLMNMLSGIYKPDSGSIFVNGEKKVFSSPRHSINTGIGMIHQHFKLIDVMSAKDNIILGQKTSFLSNSKDLIAQIEKVSNQYGLDIEPNKKVYEMSVGEKQNLEIIKVLFRGARILIMDEPTAVLTPQEIEKLFKIMRKMKEQGCAVVIITHKLNEVMEISDRITVLRKGKSVSTVETGAAEIPSLIEMMVGRPMRLSIKRKSISKKEKLMEIDDVTVIDKEKKIALDGIGFSLNSSEILGVAGVAGSGQKELCEVIAGLIPAQHGRIYFRGENIIRKNPSEIIKLGIRMGFIPEDRLGMGLVASMDIVHNIILKDYKNQPGILLKRKPSAKKAKEIVQRLEIMTPGLTTPISRLSGGNIQKVLLGREIDSDPKVLITAYPVRGLDIGASFKIYDLLNEQKERGVGIIFIGEDLDVMLELCDRIMILCNGRVTGIVDAKIATKEEIGYYMTGGGDAN